MPLVRTERGRLVQVASTSTEARRVRALRRPWGIRVSPAPHAQAQHELVEAEGVVERADLGDPVERAHVRRQPRRDADVIDRGGFQRHDVLRGRRCRARSRGALWGVKRRTTQIWP